MNAMNFALYAQRRFAAGFKAITHMLGAPTTHSSTYGPAQRTRANSPVPFAIQKRTSPAACPSALKRLRVLRVMEPGQQRTCVGRMVISGRMADVCAELDRLAAREAAMS